ncbi:hypothetical protein HDU98_002295 [Podochytrium sp. JEL0797]|nr:hypothetical protein HDU98_002295 [Podochytrium sp. JEL0797]
MSQFGFSFNGLFGPTSSPSQPSAANQYPTETKPKRKIKQKSKPQKQDNSFRFSHPYEKPKPSKAHTIHAKPPWLDVTSTSANSSSWSLLDREANLLIDYLTPLPHEISLRQHVTAQYAALIKSRFPLSKAMPFGSTGSGLFLPWSDIDLIILDPFPAAVNDTDPKQQSQSSKLSKLIPKIRQANCTASLEFIRRARVPILKLVDRVSKLHIDICYNVSGGFLAVESVREWVQRVPGLRELVLLVKLYLSSKDLGDVSMGGLGGFSIVCLCLAFLQLRDPTTGHIPLKTFSTPPLPSHKRKSSPTEPPTTSHGTTFLHFCRFFGTKFDYHSLAIGFTTPDSPQDVPEPYFFKKAGSVHMQARNPHFLVLLNPLDAAADIAKGSAQIMKVSSAFREAARVLGAEAASVVAVGSAAVTAPVAKKARKRYYERDFDRGDELPMEESVVHTQPHPAAEIITLEKSVFSKVVFVSNHMVRVRDLMKGVAVSLFGRDGVLEEEEDAGKDVGWGEPVAGKSIAAHGVHQVFDDEESTAGEVLMSGIMLQDGDEEESIQQEEEEGGEEDDEFMPPETTPTASMDDNFLPFDSGDMFTIDRTGGDPPPFADTPPTATATAPPPPQPTPPPPPPRTRKGFTIRAAEKRMTKNKLKLQNSSPQDASSSPAATPPHHLASLKHKERALFSQPPQPNKYASDNFSVDAETIPRHANKKRKFNDDYHPSKNSRRNEKAEREWVDRHSGGAGRGGNKFGGGGGGSKSGGSGTPGTPSERKRKASPSKNAGKPYRHDNSDPSPSQRGGGGGGSKNRRRSNSGGRNEEAVWKDDFVGFRGIRSGGDDHQGGGKRRR